MTVRLWANRFVTDGVPGCSVMHRAGPTQAAQSRERAGHRRRDPDHAAAGGHPLEESQPGESAGRERRHDSEDLRQHGRQPHRVGRFKLSTDPHVVEQLSDVVGLYVNPPAKAVVFASMRRVDSGAGPDAPGAAVAAGRSRPPDP